MERHVDSESDDGEYMGQWAHFLFVRNLDLKQAPQNLVDLARTTAEAMGYELVGVQLISQGNYGKTLRVYIDHEDGITVDDCASVSHQFSGVLDVEDLVKGNYELEVSSPGLDRPLFEMAHFERFIGQPANIRMADMIEGRRKFEGVIQSAADNVVTIEIEDGSKIELPFDEIDMARLVPVFEKQAKR